MTDRERWIIYPLLFFALMLAGRGQCNMSREAKFQRLTCNRLEVISSGSLAGRIDIYGKSKRRIASLNSLGEISVSTLEILSPRGKEAIRLKATDEGGVVQIVQGDEKGRLNLGYDKAAGLFATDEQEQIIQLELEDGRVVPWGRILPPPEELLEQEEQNEED